MKQNTIRLIAALLAVASAGVVATSCANQESEAGAQSSGTSAPDSSAAETEPEDYDSLEARKKVSDELPDTKFDGQKYRVLTYNSSENYIATPEAQHGDVLEDAVYERNKKIEERFDVVIDVTKNTSHRETGALLEKTVASTSDDFDVYAGHAIVSGGNAVNGMFINWKDVEHVNFSKPWWNQNSVEALTLNDRLYLVPTYYTTTVIGATYCMFYNKAIAANNNLESIYDIVNNQEWTLEKMLSTIEGTYHDLNGNGKEDADDAYGFASSVQSPTVTFTWAFDMKIIDIDEDFNVEIVLDSERNADIYASVYDLFYNTTGVTRANSNQQYGVETFLKGNTLLCTGYFDNAYASLREFEDPYAVIPYPKYDEKQKEYYSMLDGFHAVIGVPKTATHLDLLGIITEAMTAESWKDIIPKYYDVALKIKGARGDEESIAMMDLIMDAVKVDFTYIYDNWNGYAFTLQDLIGTKNQNFASFVESKKKAKLKWYEKVVKAFVEND